MRDPLELYAKALGTQLAQDLQRVKEKLLQGIQGREWRDRVQRASSATTRGASKLLVEPLLVLARQAQAPSEREEDFQVKNLRQILSLPLHVQDALGTNLVLSSALRGNNSSASVGENTKEEMLLLREIVRLRAITEKILQFRFNYRVVFSYTESRFNVLRQKLKDHYQSLKREGVVPETDFTVTNLQAILSAPYHVQDSTGSALALKALIPIDTEKVFVMEGAGIRTNATSKLLHPNIIIRPASNTSILHSMSDRYLFFHWAERTTGAILLLIALHISWLLFRTPKYRQRVFFGSEQQQQQPTMITTITKDGSLTPLTITPTSTPSRNGSSISPATPEQQKHQLQELLRQKQQECEWLTTRLNEAQKTTTEEVEEAWTQLQQHNSNLQKKIHSKDQQLLTFSTQVQRLHKDLAARETQLTHLLGKYANQKQELEQRKKQQASQKQTAEQEKTVLELTSSLKESQEQSECLSKRLEEVSAELAQFKNEQRQAAEHVQKRRSNQNEEAKPNLQGELDAQVSQNNQLAKELEEQRLVCNEMKGQLARYQQQKVNGQQQQEGRRQKMDEQIQLQKQEVNALREEPGNKIIRCKELEDQMERKTQQKSEEQKKLQEQLDNKLIQCSRLEEELVKKEETTRKKLEEEKQHASQQQKLLQDSLDAETKQCHSAQERLMQQELVQQNIQEQLDMQIQRVAGLEEQFRQQEVTKNQLQEQLDSQIERVRQQEAAHNELQQHLAEQCKDPEQKLQERLLVQSNQNGEQVQEERTSSSAKDEGEEKVSADASGNPTSDHPAIHSNLQERMDQCDLLEKQVEHHRSLQAKHQERNKILMETNQTLMEMVDERQNRCKQLEDQTATLSLQLEKHQRQGEMTHKLRLEELRLLRKEKEAKAQQLLSTQTRNAHEEQENISSVKKELQGQQEAVSRLLLEIETVKQDCNDQLEEMKRQYLGERMGQGGCAFCDS